MKVNGTPTRTIWPGSDGWSVEIIDQTKLPHRWEVARLTSLEEAATAIREMWVRGAPLIGATAAWGMALAMRQDSSDESLQTAHDLLYATRPTAVNLPWALKAMMDCLRPLPPEQRYAAACQRAAALCDEDVAINHAISSHGLELFRDIWKRRQAAGASRLNVLTHCNAGWLATVDWGTALAPIYRFFDEGLPIHVWVDETRPRNQGASLTAWELKSHGVPHTVIPDNVGGHLMQHGMVDLCIVGTDRTTSNGDVCNKIGTYLKALAAHDNGVPFFVALPGPTIDWSLTDGIRQIPIEERDPREVTHMTGRTESGDLQTVIITPEGSPAGNWGFDVTPARYVTALITERGSCPATREGLLGLYPEQAAQQTAEPSCPGAR